MAALAGAGPLMGAAIAVQSQNGRFQDRLIEIERERDVQHRTFMERLQNDRESFQAVLEQREARSQETIQALRAEHSAQIERLIAENNKLQAENEKRIEDLQKEHMEHVKQIREKFESVSKSVKEDHKMQITSLNEKNEQEVKILKEQLDAAKNESEEKLKVERQKIEKSMQDIRDSGDQHRKEIEVFIENCFKKINDIRDENAKLDVVVAEEKRKKCQAEHALIIRVQNEHLADTQNIIAAKQSCELVGKYQEVLNSVDAINSSVRQMGSFIAKAKIDISTVTPGSLDPFVDLIRQERNTFANKIQLFRQYSNNLPSVPREVSLFLKNLTIQLETTMNNSDPEGNSEVLAFAYNKRKVKKMIETFDVLNQMVKKLEDIKIKEISNEDQNFSLAAQLSSLNIGDPDDS